MAEENAQADAPIVRAPPNRLGRYCPHCETATSLPEYPEGTEAWARSTRRNDFTDRHTDGGCWNAVRHEHPFICIRILRDAIEELRADVDSLMKDR